MILQLVIFRSGLSEPEIRRTIEERAHHYRELPGLIQQYYIQDPEKGDYGGLYVWDDEQAMLDFRSSELARTVNDAYSVVGNTWVDRFEVMSVLRADESVALQR